MSKKTSTEIPWHNSKKWKYGEWYPMPIGYMARDQPEYIIDGYMIFKKQNDVGDITPVNSLAMTFASALDLCEMHNERRMLE